MPTFAAAEDHPNEAMGNPMCLSGRYRGAKKLHMCSKTKLLPDSLAWTSQEVKRADQEGKTVPTDTQVTQSLLLLRCDLLMFALYA